MYGTSTVTPKLNVLLQEQKSGEKIKQNREEGGKANADIGCLMGKGFSLLVMSLTK